MACNDTIMIKQTTTLLIGSVLLGLYVLPMVSTTEQSDDVSQYTNCYEIVTITEPTLSKDQVDEFCLNRVISDNMANN